MRIDIEQLQADYFDSDALKESSVKLRRCNIKGKRYYYTAIEGEIKLYPSVTTITRAVLPTSPYLTSWIASMGEKDAKEYSKMKAHYGTIMHAVFSRFLIAKKISIPEDVEAIANEYAEKEKISIENGWIDDLCQDVSGFAQFCIDYEIKPLAIEVPLHSTRLVCAGAIDLIAEITIEEKGFWGEEYKSGEKKGHPKETKRKVNAIAIIDYKSGRNGSYLDNEVQLAFYEQIVEENFPEICHLAGVKLLNYHPKDWKSTPSYTVHDQTNKHPLNILQNYIELYNYYNPNSEAITNKEYDGVLEFGKSSIAHTITPVVEILNNVKN